MTRPGAKIHWTRERIISEIKSHADEKGFVGWRGLPGGLRSAVEREFGSGKVGWHKACKEAGVKPRPRGRPEGSPS